MKNIMKRLSTLIILISVLILPYLVFAQTPEQALKKVGGDSGFAEADETTISTIAGTAVSVVLGLLGVAFVMLMIYGGFRWMNAQGNEQEVDTAKNILKNSIIGLVIVVSAYAIYGLVAILMVM